MSQPKAKERVHDGDYEVGVGGQMPLDALAGYTAITGMLVIRETYLTDLRPLKCLQTVGSLRIQHNSALTSLGGLSGLTSVGGQLFIHANDALANVDGLRGLTSVGGTLYIYCNGALTNVDGLRALTSVAGSLRIWHNTALTNVDGLGGLTSVGGDMIIRENIVLPTCEAEALRDRLISKGWGGECHIKDNGAARQPFNIDTFARFLRSEVQPVAGKERQWNLTS